MKKYIISLLAAGAVIAFAACQKQETTLPSSGKIVTLTAELENSDTKVTTGSEIGKFVWESGDQIGVWVGDAFVPFTLEASSVGAAAGKFTGTVPEGKEIQFAVYPYSDKDTYVDGVYTTNYSTGWYGGYKSCVHLYAPKADQNSLKFQHLCAYILLTIKNVRSDCKYVYLESPNGSMLITGGQSADLTAEWPKFTSGGGESAFIALPEDHSKIVIYAPILPGEWADGKAFKVKFFKDLGWAYEYGKGDLADEPVINHIGALTTGGVINRGEIVVLPEIVFEGGQASGLSATIEGGLTWLSGSTIGLWDGSSMTSKTVSSGNVAVGEFEGDVPTGATVAVSPVDGVSVSDNTLSISKGQYEYTLGASLYGTVGEPASSAYLKSVAFKHLGAVVRATLNNVPENATNIFIETNSNSKFFYTAATCDLSASEPTLTATDTKDWVFAALPAHSAGAKIVIDIPIAPGEYERTNPGVNIELYTTNGFAGKIDNSKVNNTLESGSIKRGDVFELSYNWE